MHQNESKVYKKDKEVQHLIRVSNPLSQKIENLILKERERTGYNVSRTDILRKVVALGIERMEKSEL
ncbi:MAG: hypothetical protein GY751_01835 [Bacteroidetes bacterium]|nr:hypothetical protein [Bacteroidota bacterium]